MIDHCIFDWMQVLIIIFLSIRSTTVFPVSGDMNISQDSSTVQYSRDLQLSGHQTGSLRQRQDKKLSDKAAGRVQKNIKNIPQKPKVRNYNYKDDNGLR